MSEWIPCKERLPERATGGMSNWHTDTVIVCMYGNGQYEGWEHFDYEILTGIFIEIEDTETKEKRICFEPDRITLFMPDEWDVFVFDDNFKSHLSKDECTYFTDESCETVEFHDRYFEVLAWQPLPEPYMEVTA